MRALFRIASGLFRLALALGLATAALSTQAAAAPIPIKVVVLTTFERGATASPTSGEFRAWAERWPLTHPLKVPGVPGRVLYSDDGVLGVVTGMRARARESVAAIVLDPRLDVSHAYWLVAGIAGVDPRAGSIGSAAWARFVVDADPDFELDDRETPAGWPEGLWSLNASRPGVKGSAPGSSGMVWKLNPGLVAWAYGLTRGLAPPDSPQLSAARAGYPEEPAARLPPHVFLGDDLGTTRFWHGARRTQWARDWVALWTDGQGQFAMSECEDQGILDVLDLFAREGRVDLARVLVLRTASNYTREPAGHDPTPHFTPGGADAAFEAAWQVGAPVARALVAGWDRYAAAPPAAR